MHVDTTSLIKGGRNVINREMPKSIRSLLIALSLGFTIYILYTCIFGPPASYLHRVIFVTLVLAQLFLSIPAIKKDTKTFLKIDTVFAIFVLIIGIYVWLEFPDIQYRAGKPLHLDIIFSGILTLLIIEAARRSIGPALPIIAIISMSAALLGPNLPVFPHGGMSLKTLLDYHFTSTLGIFGTMTASAANHVAIFIIFSAFLQVTGASEFFIDISNSLFGHKVGGPAKAAVVSSGFVGMLSGAAVANVVTTGSFTIPLMKKMGYEPEFAGATEAAASTGGQFMPPIMGATAFIIAAYTGIPYATIAVACFIPAIIYFFSVGFMVHFRAMKNGLLGLPKSECPVFLEVMKKQGYLIIPVLSLVYFLFIGRTPMLAGAYSLLILLLVVNIREDSRLNLKKIYDGLIIAAQDTLAVGATVFCAEIVVTSLIITGISMSITTALVEFAGGNLALILFFAMISSLILGMGLPTIGCYVLVSTVVAPILVKMGIPVLGSHLFVFFFGIIANITPPVAIASFAAAAIAGSNPFKTGIAGFKMSLPSYFIPFLFIYRPALILQEGVSLYVWTGLIALLGVACLAASIEGYLLKRTKIWERLVLAIAGLSLLFHSTLSDFLGFALFIGIFLIQLRAIKSEKNNAMVSNS